MGDDEESSHFPKFLSDKFNHFFLGYFGWVFVPLRLMNSDAIIPGPQTTMTLTGPMVQQFDDLPYKDVSK